MKEINVTFAGHRVIDDARRVESDLYDVLSEIVREHEFTEFFVGDNGEFDILATSVIRRVRKVQGEEKCAINLVLPYTKSNQKIIEHQFDSVIIPPRLHGAHPKAAIGERNRWMVENCDLIICYVKRKGGAERTMRYAKKSGKIEVVNLARL